MILTSVTRYTSYWYSIVLIPQEIPPKWFIVVGNCQGRQLQRRCRRFVFIWKYVKNNGYILFSDSQKTLTMFVGVVALRYQHHTTCVVLITECHNSHKHSQSPLTNFQKFFNVNYDAVKTNNNQLLYFCSYFFHFTKENMHVYK